MKALLIPLVALLVGLGAGVGGGIVLSGSAPEGAEHASADAEDHAAAAHDTHDDHDTHDSHDAHDAHDTQHDTASDHGSGHGHGAETDSFYSIPGQFIVPVMHGEHVAALVLISVGLDTQEDSRSDVVHMEPRLRAAFLAALFDLSSIGGLDGDITAPEWRSGVVRALEGAAHDLAGDKITEVQLMEVNKQEI